MSPALLLVLIAQAPPAPVPVTDLAPWEAALGFAPPVPAGCRVAALGASLLVDCAGSGLVIAPAGTQDASPSALIASQTAPFAAAGIKVPSPAAQPCTLQGAAAACLGTTIQVPPGAPMVLLAGQRPDQGWSALCLHRQPSTPPVCAALFSTE